MNESHSSEPRTSGSFDPERAARLRVQARDAFEAKYRLAARLSWGYLLGCVLAGWWCVHMFLADADVRSWILWGVLFIAAFETTVLMKLWYWVVNSKLATLRELKLLRMDLALQRQSHATLEELARMESPTKVPGIGKWEGYAWLGAFIAAGLLIGLEIARHADRFYRASGQMTAESQLTLSDDGTAQVRATYTLVNSSSRALRDFTVYSGGTISGTMKIPIAESRWSDGQGRKLEVVREADPKGPNHRDVIQLLEPVPPGQSFTLSTTFTRKAQRENGVWVFTQYANWGYHRNLYRDTVLLPPGAELVSAEPGATRLEHQDGRAVLHFEGERSAGAKWLYVVKYQLRAK